jgi:hypothetical protein
MAESAFFGLRECSPGTPGLTLTLGSLRRQKASPREQCPKGPHSEKGLLLSLKDAQHFLIFHFRYHLGKK